jgi:enoyl-CoA hydratase/carnithine racemase
MESGIQIERIGAIATVCLNRPHKRNALDLEMWRGLDDAMRNLSADDKLRCVILRGAGREAFASGADVGEFSTVRCNSEQARAYADVTHAALQAVATCRHPTLAMIHGACVGGGLEIASMCDLRICGASSRFGIPINRLGLVLSYAELERLIALSSSAVALEILLEGRIFGAQEAFQKGLVTRVVADEAVEAESHAMADRIAQGAPLVARWHKAFVRRLAERTPLSAADMEENYACFDTADFEAGRLAFLTKTHPVFTGA